MSVNRGVLRLDGTQGKKQVWYHLEANMLYWKKYLQHYWDFVVLLMIQYPGHCFSTSPSQYFPECHWIY